MVKMLRVALALIIGTYLSACETAGIAPAEGNVTTESSRQVSEYKLGVSDQIRVIVFGEEDLSGEFVVDSNGFVSIPLIGEVQASPLTTREFQKAVETKLMDGYLNSPSVSIEVLNFRPYYILGEVVNSGEFPYSNGLTVLNAIATSGGFTYRANKKYIYIKRAGDQAEIRYPLTVSTAVQPGDTIRIAERLF